MGHERVDLQPKMIDPALDRGGVQYRVVTFECSLRALPAFDRLSRRPELRCGGDVAARRRREAEVGHVLVHELELLVGDAEPGRGLDVAGGQLDERRR